jgi:ankyrin repeat protein
MTHLPVSPDLSHVRKQAKHLLRDARIGEVRAVERFTTTLPAARALGPAALARCELKLHDAQSVIAREYGFRSWTELKRFVEWKQMDRAERLKRWLEWVYEGATRERSLAVRMLGEEPALFRGDIWLACATGDEARLDGALSSDPGAANRAGGPRGMPPLVAVTHSLLILEPGFELPLLKCARLLLRHGADVNGTWIHPRWPDAPLSALYGAAGRTHHAAMTKLLLEAGANPDDNESLYHSLESPDSTCTRMLLEAGARVTGTNAIGRALDYGKIDDLRMMLRQGGDAKERPWIHHAILRGRSIEPIRVLAEAGADLRSTDRDGLSLYRWARLRGRADVAAMLIEAGVEEPLTEEEQFVAACAEGDEGRARAILQNAPDIFSRLTGKQLRALPEMADVGNLSAVRAMLALGWPREVKAAWDATALNLAVYRGDARMAELLLEQGADWRTKHGFGGNVVGTLSHASQNGPEDPAAPRDYAGCARVLVAHGVPIPDGTYTFSAEVAEYLDEVRFAGQLDLPKRE